MKKGSTLHAWDEQGFGWVKKGSAFVCVGTDKLTKSSLVRAGLHHPSRGNLSESGNNKVGKVEERAVSAKLKKK